jgi:hypothetical protein
VLPSDAWEVELRKSERPHHRPSKR